MFNTKHTAINPSGTKKFDANWDFQQKRNFRKVLYTDKIILSERLDQRGFRDLCHGHS